MSGHAPTIRYEYADDLPGGDWAMACLDAGGHLVITLSRALTRGQRSLAVKKIMCVVRREGWEIGAAVPPAAAAAAAGGSRLAAHGARVTAGALAAGMLTVAAVYVVPAVIHPAGPPSVGGTGAGGYAEAPGTTLGLGSPGTGPSPASGRTAAAVPSAGASPPPRPARRGGITVNPGPLPLPSVKIPAPSVPAPAPPVVLQKILCRDPLLSPACIEL